MNTYETADYFRQPLLKRAHDIYSLFLVGALIGWLTIPAGSVLALAAWRRTQDATLASHFRFQAFSTLWMVMAVALGIAAFFALRAFADPVICPLNRVFLPPRWSTLFVVFYGMVLYALWLARFWRGDAFCGDVFDALHRAHRGAAVFLYDQCHVMLLSFFRAGLAPTRQARRKGLRGFCRPLGRNRGGGGSLCV